VRLTNRRVVRRSVSHNWNRNVDSKGKKLAALIMRHVVGGREIAAIISNYGWGTETKAAQVSVLEVAR